MAWANIGLWNLTGLSEVDLSISYIYIFIEEKEISL